MAKTKKSKFEDNSESNTPLKTLEKLYRIGYDISNEKEILKLQMSAFRGMKDKTMDDYDNLDSLQQCIKERTLLKYFTREMTDRVDKELGYKPTKKEKTKENKISEDTKDENLINEGGADLNGE